MVNKDGDTGPRPAAPAGDQAWYKRNDSLYVDTRPRSREDTHPRRISPVWNVATLMRPGSIPSGIQGQSSHREAGYILRRRRRVQEAKAGRQKARGSHNSPDRAMLDLKGC
jgi:hypothetical protein